MKCAVKLIDQHLTLFLLGETSVANIHLALSKTAWKGVKVITAAWLAQPVFS